MTFNGEIQSLNGVAAFEGGLIAAGSFRESDLTDADAAVWVYGPTS